MRKDNKKPNTKRDPETVAIIKRLYILNIPVSLISVLYDVRDSTVCMYGLGMRQQNVEPVSTEVAKRDMNKRFQALVNLPEAA